MPHNGPERRKHRKAFMAWQSIMFIAIVLLVGLAVNRLYERTASDLKLLAVTTCESVNDGRAVTNEQSRLLRDFLLLAAERTEASAKSAPTKQERMQAGEFAARYRTLAKSYREIRLADCRYPPVRSGG